jgi:putative transposase
MPRIARLLAINYPHHITQRGNNKETVFFDEEDRKFYLKLLKKYSDQWNFNIWAYCLMPNHVHILAVPRKEKSFARGIGATNLVYTQYFNHRYRRSGRLWQNRFFSAIIEKGSYLWSVARYIERNPVRANIVKRGEDYIWSSAKAHLLKAEDDILSGESWLEENEVIAYREFLRQENQNIEDSIRKATSAGRPLGSEQFLKILEKILERDIFPRKAGRSRKKTS